MRSYYSHDYGAVLSLAVKHHLYVTVHRRFESSIRVAYSKTETVESVEHLQHTLVRESLRKTGLSGHLEITTIGDVPAGTGMGSSSTLTVGVLNALYAQSSRIVSREQLAREACEIEIDTLGHPIGKQDQYAAAFGGVNYIRFNADETVQVEPVPVSGDIVRALESRILLIYTNQQRDANDILDKQSRGTADRLSVLTEMRDLAAAMRDAMSVAGDLEEIAKLLHTGWCLKRSLGFGISGQRIDDLYDTARRAGAQGGKLLGAGGGGFILLVAPKERHERIRAALQHPKELAFGIDRLGSRVIFVSEYHD